MFDGMREISKSVFYGNFWPKISRVAAVVQSNWNSPYDECFPFFLIIKWGIMNKNKTSRTIVAITVTDESGSDRYWIDSSLT